MKTTAVADYIDAHSQSFEDDLIDLLRIPSVSADSAHKADVRKAAQWVMKKFRNLGLECELIETDGHPLVFAKSPPVVGKPTVLVYGHYDVQPPDPLGEWTTPPFEPTVRDGNLYARGATDDKGQMLTHVESVEAWVNSGNPLPLEIKFLIEGEEEIGSSNLERYVAQNREKLGCDCVVVSDTAQFAPNVPAITYGLRGIQYFELFLTGPRQDLHSGIFGGAVTNPANTLVAMLAAMIDDQGRIQVPGFYDDVVSLTDRERKQFRDLPFDELQYMEKIGVDGTTGEKDFSTLERRWARPSFDINGITTGYQGEGAKTVLPARASAKFSFRLVPNQDHKKIFAAAEKFIKDRLPLGIKMKLVDHHGAPGFVMPLESPYMKAAVAAIETGFGRPPVFIREGGSIPIVMHFAQQLKADVLLLGWGLNDDNAHSPNEKFSLADYHRGIRASAALWYELAKI